MADAGEKRQDKLIISTSFYMMVCLTSWLNLTKLTSLIGVAAGDSYILIIKKGMNEHWDNICSLYNFIIIQANPGYTICDTGHALLSLHNLFIILCK